MKSTLIICALVEEVNAVKSQFKQVGQEVEINSVIGLYCTRYQTEREIFYIVLSGMGPINATLRLSQVLTKLNIDQVYLLGVAGGLTSKTQIGDLVISKGVVQHDYFSSLESGDFVMKSGDLILSETDSKNYDPFLYAHQELITLCLKTKIEGHQIFIGMIASGSEFVGRSERKIKISKMHPDLLAVDMEASAVANVCTLFKIPFVVAKTISDTLHTDGSIETDFVKFLHLASLNAAQVVKVITEP